MRIHIKLNHVNAIIALDVVCKNPGFLFHASHCQEALVAKIVKDRVVDDVDSGEMTSDGEAEIVIVGEMVTVCKSRNYFVKFGLTENYKLLSYQCEQCG